MSTTWRTIRTVIDSAEIRIDLLESGPKTAGWIVRRACNVYQVFKPPASRPEDGVVDLLSDGVCVGIASQPVDAQALLLDETGIGAPDEIIADNVVYLNVPRPEPVEARP